ncbi:MAG: DUF58 domain-containing protein [Acidimicrobiia bacterium]
MVVTAVAALFIAVVVRIEFGLAVVFLLTAIVAIGLAVPGNIARHLEVDRSFSERAFFGERVPVRLTIRNGSLLPALWVEVWELLPLSIAPEHASIKEVIAIPGRDQKELRYEVHCRRRGYWRLGPTSLTTGDVLGVSVKRPQPHPADYLIVYPKILSLDRLGLPTRSPLAELPTPASLFSDPARVMGVDEYRIGDSLRRIHWTASARTGDLMVKQIEPAVARDTMIYLDLNRPNYALGRTTTGPELAITVAASLAAHITEREGQPVGLTVRARDPLARSRVEIVLPPEASRYQLMAILEILARFQTDSETDFGELLRSRAPHLSWGSTLAVVTGSVSRDLAETLLLLQKAGFAVAVYLVQPELDLDTRGLSSAGLKVHQIDREQHLSTI